MKPFRSEAPVVCRVTCTSRYASVASIFPPNFHPASVGARYTGRLYPVIRRCFSSFINSGWPFLEVRGAVATDVVDAVARLIHTALFSWLHSLFKKKPFHYFGC